MPYKEFVQIFDLNIHITDHCNLKCELCCHNAQFVEDEVFVDFNMFQKDIQRLKELVPNICHFTLVGGEPLLHPQLSKFMACLRANYPYAQISLVTNGILLQECSGELLDCISENNILVSVSLYPPMHEKLDILLEYMRKNNIQGSINRVDKFFKKFCDSPMFNAARMSSNCGYCMGLRNGHISRCIDSFFVDYLNKRYNLNLPTTTGIDIYEPDLLPLDMIHQLEQPIELCAYCASELSLWKLFEWKKISDNTEKRNVLWTADDLCNHNGLLEVMGIKM